MKRFPLRSAILLALSLSAVQAQATVTEIDPFKFKSGDLKGHVEEALRHSDDRRVVELLMELHQNEPDKVLALLEPYIKHPDENTRSAVLVAASRAHTSKALALLGTLACDETLSSIAAGKIFDGYTAKELRGLGGQRLQRALFRSAFGSRYSTHSYLLLASFRSTLDAGAIRFLERRRQSFRASTDARDTTSEVVSLDLALAEIGSAQAQQRMTQLFARKETNKLLEMLRFLKYVTNKAVLLQTVELLNDKSKAKEVTNTDGSPLAHSRLCDEALVALAPRARLPLKFKMEYQGFLAPRFSDQELAQSRQRLRTIFQAQR